MINQTTDSSMLYGPVLSGKTSKLLEKYLDMVQNQNIPSESILILLLNRSQSLDWRSRTILSASGSIFRTSFLGFIQNEIKAYYPILLKNCPMIKKKNILPVFLNFECSQYLISMVIERHRQSGSIFSGITSANPRIAADMGTNLLRSAASNIPVNSIGKRLFNSLEFKDPIRKQHFEDGDNILMKYRNRCIELGLYDYGIALELYNTYLLNDETYKSSLQKRIKHLIVDNIEESIPAEVEFILKLMPMLSSCTVAFNSEGGFAEASGGNIDFVKKNLAGKFHIIEMKRGNRANQNIIRFADALKLRLEQGFEKNKPRLSSEFDTSNELETKNHLKIETDDELKIKASAESNAKPEIKASAESNEKNETSTASSDFLKIHSPLELRSDMLEEIGECICDLIENQGYQPGEIAVITTFADPVTEYVIERILTRKGHKLKNSARRSKVIDNPFAQALITLAHLCHPQYGIYPFREDVKNLIRLVLGIDPIRSSILAAEICSRKPFAEFPDIEFPGLVERIGYSNVERYEKIRDWIDVYKTSESLGINIFFQKVFMEILLSSNVTENDIMQAHSLIDSATTFCDVVDRFGMDSGKEYLRMLRNGIKASESIYQLEEENNLDRVMLTTPVSFLSSGHTCKVLILTSLSSSNWYPRSTRELTNPHVLTATWQEGDLYTEELESENQKKFLGITLGTLLKRCSEKILTFESEISQNGFENDGDTAEVFRELEATWA